MNTFWKCSGLLALALFLQFSLRAAPGDAGKFSGTVTDAQGKPVAGAAVDWYSYTGGQTLAAQAKLQVTTDGQGAFEILTPGGQGLVLVTKAGLAPAWRSVYSDQLDAQKITLGAFSPLAGTVMDEAGKPVADAEVWVTIAVNLDQNDLGQPNILFGQNARNLFSTRTSADGKFRLESFPTGAQAVLAVKKNGKALHQSAAPFQLDHLPYHSGQEDITLTLEPAGSVTGKIVVRGTGQPLASAMIGLVSATAGVQNIQNWTSDQETNYSAADGAFRIRDVPAGSYRVMAEFTNQPVADWIADPVPVTVAAGQPAPEVQLQAYKGGVLEVTVRGKKNHQLIGGVNVSANRQDNNQTRFSSRIQVTGTNGLVVFRLPAAQFTVFAYRQNLSQAQTQTTVTEGQTTQVTIELGEPSQVSGIIRNTSGAPVAGASVGVVPDYVNGGSGANSDAAGHYVATWQKPSWAGMQNQTFYLVARQTDLKLAAIQELGDAATNVDVTLKPAMTISGRVQDSGGKPIVNADAYIILHEENSSFTITSRRVMSDEQGRIQFETLPQGERYGWSVSARGYGNGQQEMDAADPKADHYDFPPLVLKLANRKLAGRVLGADGKPVADVQVWMNGEGQPNGNATTDADGRFAFDAVCAGPISVSANGNGLSGSADATGGDTNVVIRFDARNTYVNQAAQSTLTGTVFDPAGNHAAGAVVVVSPSFGVANTTKTDADGDYSIGWQSQPGMRAKYFVIARDLERNLAAIEPIDTDSTHMSLKLEPGLSISGTVQDRSGAALPRANINLNIMAGNMGGMIEYTPIKLDSSGAFTIPALPMGQQYFVSASAKGYGTVSRNITKNKSQTNSIQLAAFKLKAADRPLAGQVVDADDKPLPGVQVNINGNGQPNGFMRTDENGHFKFTVCDGPIQVFAYSQGGAGRNNSGTAQAQGGETNVVVKMGVRQRQVPIVVSAIPLKPQPWTLPAILAWLTAHKTGAVVLLSLQAAVLLGTSGGIFWFVRKHGGASA